MKICSPLLIFLLIPLLPLMGEIVTHTSRYDFIEGEFFNTALFTPDPDGTDDGAVGIPHVTPRFNLLIVYPPDSDPERVAMMINYYESGGVPPVLIDCYIFPVTQYNLISSVDDSLSVTALPGSRRLRVPLTFFDAMLFGVNDVYGYMDISASATELTRQFARLGGKVIIFTHSTIWSADWASHPNFNSLVDIHNIMTSPQASFDTFNLVCAYPDGESQPILFAPWELPDTFAIAYTHRRGQIPQNDEILYIGCGYSDYRGVYLSQHYSSETGSYGVFINYGHTVTAPAPWDAKVTINAIYQAFRDSLVAGSYISGLIDLGESEGELFLVRMELSASGDGDVVVEVRWSENAFDFSEWQRILPDTLLKLPVARYLQYKLLFTGRRLSPPVVHWISFYYTSAGITHQLSHPLPGTVSSCPNQHIVVKVRSFAGFDTSSVRLLVQGEEYTLDDVELHLEDDTLLIFNPSRPYNHAESVDVTLLPISDSLGIFSTDTLSWRFFIDLLSPQIVAFSPSPETTFATFPETIRFVIREEITTAIYDSLLLSVRGSSSESLFTITSPYLAIVGDTLLFTPPPSYFPYGREYRLMLAGICDSPDYCSPNCMRDFSFSLFVGRFSFALPETSATPAERLILPLVSAGGDGQIDSIKVGMSFDPSVVSWIDLEPSGGWAEGAELEILFREEGSLTFMLRGTLHITDGVMLWVILDISPSALGWDFTSIMLGQVLLQGGYDAGTRDGFVVILPIPVTWLFDLTFRSTTGHNTIITFGMSPEGSFGFDPGVDRPYMPSPPDYIAAFFPISDPSYPYITALSRDVRALANYEEWLILSYGRGQLSWERSALPEGQFLLNDIVDLRVHDSLTLGERESLVVSYELPLPAVGTIGLSGGWNLISIPYSLARPNEPLRVFPCTIGYPYSFRGSRGYYQTTSLEPGYGYWVLSLQAGECRIAGLRLNSKRVILEPGWNLVGGLEHAVEFTASSLSPPSAYIPNSLYSFSPERLSYLLSDSLIPTRGYFLMVAEPCTLNLNER